MTKREIAATVSQHAARVVFDRRGNHREAHLSENELATICAAVAEVAIERAVRALAGGQTTVPEVLMEQPTPEKT